MICNEKNLSIPKRKKITINILHELFDLYNHGVSSYAESWFNEGFTEYFCRLLSLNKSEFIKEINDIMVQYMINPYRNTNISILTKENFWNNKYIEKLPYTKGCVYALYLHQKYKNKFIDNFKNIIRDIRKNVKFNNPRLKNYLQNNIDNDINFDKYIIDGATISIKSNHNNTIMISIKQ